MSKEKNSSNFGVLIILIGIAILLYNLNILKVGMFWGIVRLWPLLLVIGGLNIIFKNVRYMGVILWLIFLGIVIGYSYLNADEMTWFFGEDVATMEQTFPVDTLDKGQLDLDLSTGKISIDSGNMSEIICLIPEKGMDTMKLDTTGDTTVLRLADNEQGSFGIFQSKSFDIAVPTQGQWYFNIDGGVLSIDLHLEDLNLIGGDIDFGVGDVELWLGENVNGSIDINMGVGDVEVHVPDSLGVKIISTGGLVSVDTPDYSHVDDVYYSDNYEDAENRVDIYLDLGIGSFDIK